MPLDFPNTPAVNSTYTDAGKTWVYNGTSWTLITYVGALGDGVVNTAQLANSAVTGEKLAPTAAIQPTIVDAKGDLIVASASDTVQRLPVGATNGQLLQVDSAQSAGITWSSVLTSPIFVGAEERWNIVASSATGTISVDVLTASAWYYTTAASANWTLNFRGNGSTTLGNTVATGDSVTVTFASLNGATAYRPTVFQIDGSTVSPLWQGGAAPAGGNANSTDVYSFTIIKTAATPSYTVFALQSRFA